MLSGAQPPGAVEDPAYPSIKGVLPGLSLPAYRNGLSITLFRRGPGVSLISVSKCSEVQR